MFEKKTLDIQEKEAIKAFYIVGKQLLKDGTVTELVSSDDLEDAFNRIYNGKANTVTKNAWHGFIRLIYKAVDYCAEHPEVKLEGYSMTPSKTRAYIKKSKNWLFKLYQGVVKDSSTIEEVLEEKEIPLSEEEKNQIEKENQEKEEEERAREEWRLGLRKNTLEERKKQLGTDPPKDDVELLCRLFYQYYTMDYFDYYLVKGDTHKIDVGDDEINIIYKFFLMCLDATTTPETVKRYSDGKYFGKMMKRALEMLKGYKYPSPSIELDSVGRECKNLIKNYTVFKDEEDLHKAFEMFCKYYDLIFEHWQTSSDPRWVYEGFSEEELKKIEALG